MSECSPPLIHRFTAENARRLGQKGLEARKRKRTAELARLANFPEDADQASRHKRVLLQIQRCDQLLENCKADEFPALTTAKARLWELILPKAGVLRPKRSLEAARRPSVEPILANSAPQAVEPPPVQPAA